MCVWTERVNTELYDVVHAKTPTSIWDECVSNAKWRRTFCFVVHPFSRSTNICDRGVPLSESDVPSNASAEFNHPYSASASRCPLWKPRYPRYILRTPHVAPLTRWKAFRLIRVYDLLLQTVYFAGLSGYDLSLLRSRKLRGLRRVLGHSHHSLTPPALILPLERNDVRELSISFVAGQWDQRRSGEAGPLCRDAGGGGGEVRGWLQNQGNKIKWVEDFVD
jgi:hypothetical protein